MSLTKLCHAFLFCLRIYLIVPIILQAPHSYVPHICYWRRILKVAVFSSRILFSIVDYCYLVVLQYCLFCNACHNHNYFVGSTICVKFIDFIIESEYSKCLCFFKNVGVVVTITIKLIENGVLLCMYFWLTWECHDVNYFAESTMCVYFICLLKEDIGNTRVQAMFV